MASACETGVIIDLGAGSGIVTERLLRSGVDAERILAIELSPCLAAICKQRFPTVTVLTGDARELGRLLERHALGKRVACIVSSLPLRVLPANLVREILLAIKAVLGERGGFLVQYTYAWWRRDPLKQHNFSSFAGQLVLRNCPPAKVQAYLGKG